MQTGHTPAQPPPIRSRAVSSSRQELSPNKVGKSHTNLQTSLDMTEILTEMWVLNLSFEEKEGKRFSEYMFLVWSCFFDSISVI